jgi:pimeloyl-ACP methyl ester carboxylesterase
MEESYKGNADARETLRFRDVMSYGIDTAQRWVLFTDTLRKRGNIYLQHLRDGQPPVLAFPYDLVMDGRDLERPVNYSLVRILDRRTGKRADAGADLPASPPPQKTKSRVPERPKRPFVIIDPRAGHGPGIGGSKRDSEIGVAVNAGHPVYFIIFSIAPVPGQTIADVELAEVQFIEKVALLHPEAEKPAVIGNCQGGWAAALINADRPDIVGPVVMNGSPLSYWSGPAGKDPLRYRGGLTGGLWLTSFLSDLGGGLFDGATLVSNMEDLNPANTLWKKQYNLFSNIDTEAERYLGFEKWWGGFFLMTDKEMRFIVRSLFVGDKLENGTLVLDDGRTINLRNIKEPLVIFTSEGDNITPPQQALHWITKVYMSEQEIRKNGQVIVYVMHKSIGHLGIFVSTGIARKEHREIIGSVEMIGYLAPGLYEMIIQEEPSQPWTNDYQVRFEKRTFRDILAIGGGSQHEESFPQVSVLSAQNDRLYQMFVSPGVRFLTTPVTAECLRQSSHMRWSRYLLSDLNPCFLPLGPTASWVRDNRNITDDANPCRVLEAHLSDQVAASLDFYRDIRDAGHEYLFKSLYGNPWLKLLACLGDDPDAGKASTPEPTPPDIGEYTQGGFAAAVVRIMMAMAEGDQIFDERELSVIKAMIRVNGRLQEIGSKRMKYLIKGQTRLLDTDRELALKTLASLLPTRDDRVEALEIAKNIADTNFLAGCGESGCLRQIETILTIG